MAERQPARRRGGSRRGAARGRRHGRAGPGQPRPQKLEPAASSSSTSPRRRSTLPPVRAKLCLPRVGLQAPGLPRTAIARCSPAPPPRRARTGSRTRRRDARSGACGASSRRCGRGARSLRAQPDGSELDMDALVRSRVDLAAGGGAGSDASISMPATARATSRSRSWSTPRSRPTAGSKGRRVLDVEKAALTALAFGHRRLRRPVGDPGLHLSRRRRGQGADVSRASTSP